MSRPDEWITSLSSEKVRDFLEEHQDDDPFELSLRFREIEEIPISVIVNQIHARQKIKAKVPGWYQSRCIIYPPVRNLEQASSEATAKYKAEILNGDCLVDLTGGTGVDTSFLADGFEKTFYVEKEEFLRRLAVHNFNCLDKDIEVVSKSAENFLRETEKSSLSLYIDPSRRTADRRKVFLLADCSPDISEILPIILKVSTQCLVKLSPLLDLSQTTRDLSPYVHEIHVVAVENEVKETLFLIRPDEIPEPTVYAVNLQKKGRQIFQFSPDDEREALCSFGHSGKYLHEPNSAILKSGAFNLAGLKFNLKKAAPNTHLYFSDVPVENFPGRSFLIEEITGYQPRKLKKELGQKKANISIRNFPEEVKKIRKRTAIREGGNIYLFFFRAHDDSLRMARCRKTNMSSSRPPAE